MDLIVVVIGVADWVGDDAVGEVMVVVDIVVVGMVDIAVDLVVVVVVMLYGVVVLVVVVVVVLAVLVVVGVVVVGGGGGVVVGGVVVVLVLVVVVVVVDFDHFIICDNRRVELTNQPVSFQ